LQKTIFYTIKYANKTKNALTRFGYACS